MSTLPVRNLHIINIIHIKCVRYQTQNGLVSHSNWKENCPWSWSQSSVATSVHDCTTYISLKTSRTRKDNRSVQCGHSVNQRLYRTWRCNVERLRTAHVLSTSEKWHDPWFSVWFYQAAAQRWSALPRSPSCSTRSVLCTNTYKQTLTW